MNYKQNLFYAIKLLYILIILVESAVLKMIIAPDGFYEGYNVYVIFPVYMEHLILSIIILSVGALIFLRKVWFLCILHKNKFNSDEYFHFEWIKVVKWKVEKLFFSTIQFLTFV